MIPSILCRNQDYTIYGGSGTDLIFAGSGNVTVYGGSGTDLIAAGSGNAALVAGNGTDVLETDSTGANVLIGGHGEDAFIVNRGGTNTLLGGTGADLFILKESASLVNADGTFNFGQEEIAGGKGGGTLLFIINDQNPVAKNALKAEFQSVVSAFNAAAHDHHPGSFQIDGLQVTGITGLELQVDSVSTDSHTPYLITHKLVQIVSQAPEVSSELSSLLHTAHTWNLLYGLIKVISTPSLFDRSGTSGSGQKCDLIETAAPASRSQSARRTGYRQRGNGSLGSPSRNSIIAALTSAGHSCWARNLHAAGVSRGTPKAYLRTRTKPWRPAKDRRWNSLIFK
jgi:hypothetical protein